ncbi:hypothetical protein CkaCkLH20_04557 [Colletotrichum karsti]|uniref:Nudix hydrolase domain-containing protein n=1 Tax=Colletotrichum karsti TaxID=1095194 RepID=A0A9P6LM96_9PEZI|nr:uncharacterized protein CkaCkLH20_04557 [Colletotrichum karsti]KAF9877981.1 hypothetical protein CkaCkLH20_04557 [Colletotrichum karsti]
MASAKPSPPTFTLTHPPSLEPYNLPAKAWLAANDKHWDGLATGALVFDARDRILLLQRAAHDSMPNLWETPGGAADAEDASLLIACARELWEEAGLEAVEVVRVVSEGEGREPGSVFTNRTGTVVFCRFAFEVRVRGAEEKTGEEMGVRIDPEEHQDYVWASEEEVRAQRVGGKETPVTNGQMMRGQRTQGVHRNLHITHRDRVAGALEYRPTSSLQGQQASPRAAVAAGEASIQSAAVSISPPRSDDKANSHFHALQQARQSSLSPSSSAYRGRDTVASQSPQCLALPLGAISANGKLDSNIHPRRRLLLSKIPTRPSVHTTTAKPIANTAHPRSPSQTEINTHHVLALRLCTPRTPTSTRAPRQEEETVKGSVADHHLTREVVTQIQHQAIFLALAEASPEPIDIACVNSNPVETAQQGTELSQQTLYVQRAMAEALRPPLLSAQYNTPGQRSSLMSVRSAKSNVTSMVTEIPKPVAHGSGVSCSILMAEPNIFLTGFEHDGHRHHSQGGTALLRGKLQLKVSKNVKIKGISLKLAGKARTEWPEGIPPLKVDLYEEESLRTQVLTFFNAMNDGWETDYGNQCQYVLKNSSSNSSSTNLASGSPRNSISPSLLSIPQNRQGQGLTAKELKRLSLQSNQSRSFGKGDNPNGNQAKGYKVFYPGTYEYTFELPIDHHQLETTKLQYGSVKWELQATVERAGAFKPNLHGSKEVAIVRVPDQLSLEMTEPISISRQWEDQLHYDIIISGKSFPIGTKIPIAFKLTPLAKVQVHKLKVFVTESIEYWTNDRRVTRKDPGRKILLLEKTAGKPLDPAYASSDVRVLNGGELTPRQRREAREAAAMRRAADASRHGVMPEPLPEPVDNILGDLDLGLESYWGSTEIEMNVQLPTCDTMAKDKQLRLHPDCSWKNVNVYHWIKIVMRISRIDPEDPTGTKRRHFEISIDSPFTVLNCRATQANTALPEYSGPDSLMAQSRQTSCGCPDAATIAGPPEGSPNNLSTSALTITDAAADLPAPPQAAHLPASPTPTPAGGRSSPPNSQTSVDPLDNQARPIHLLRVPSYNPPAFDAETPPPPAENQTAQTPPPQYDVIVGTPSVDGLADYFARLADYGYDEPEEDSDSDEGPARISERGGRVNVAHPRTPGGRRAPSRSLEIQRPPVELRLDSLPRLARQP